VWEREALLRIDDDARSRVRAGVMHASPVAVAPAGEALVTDMETTAARLLSTHAGQSPGAIPGLAAARELYRAFGMDPTHTRPSSEALLRRVLQGKGLPRILNAVDLCNLCALRFLLPIGLYDAATVVPPVTLRRGRPGETYAGIRKDEVHLEGRPVLVDAEGPFGNPTSDSLRTSVSPSTRALVMVIFAPAAYTRDNLTAHVEEAAVGAVRHLAAGENAVVTSGALVPAD
jgi:DNA/RNA-binding domain of Phe-tRNA-synthetase-like protein